MKMKFNVTNSLYDIPEYMLDKITSINHDDGAIDSATRLFIETTNAISFFHIRIKINQARIQPEYFYRAINF